MSVPDHRIYRHIINSGPIQRKSEVFRDRSWYELRPPPSNTRYQQKSNSSLCLNLRFIGLLQMLPYSVQNKFGDHRRNSVSDLSANMASDENMTVRGALQCSEFSHSQLSHSVWMALADGTSSRQAGDNRRIIPDRVTAGGRWRNFMVSHVLGNRGKNASN